MSIKNLAIMTFSLFLVSIGVYYNENYRSSGLVSGSYFIKGLDLNKVYKISLTHNKDKVTTFTKDGSRFVLESHKSYPARVDKVNDLIYQIASVQVSEKIKSNAREEDFKKYGLDKASKRYKVDIFDKENQKIQSFLVGNKFKNKGHYLFKEGGKDIYLSKGAVWLESNHTDFIQTHLMKVDEKNVDIVSLKSKEEVKIKQEEDKFSLILPEKSADEAKLRNYVSGFKQARFEDFFSVDDPKVKSVNFEKSLAVKLKNKLSYQVQIGEQEGKYYVRASALASEIPNQVTIDQNADKKDLQAVEDIIQAKQEAERFNLEKGMWVYLVDKNNYQKLVKNVSEFM